MLPFPLGSDINIITNTNRNVTIFIKELRTKSVQSLVLEILIVGYLSHFLQQKKTILGIYIIRNTNREVYILVHLSPKPTMYELWFPR